MKGGAVCKSPDVTIVQDAGSVCNTGGTKAEGVDRKQEYITKMKLVPVATLHPP
jgi:hypothetical protein